MGTFRSDVAGAASACMSGLKPLTYRVAVQAFLTSGCQIKETRSSITST